MRRWAWRAALLAGWLAACAPTGPAAPTSILTPLPPLPATASPAVTAPAATETAAPPTPTATLAPPTASPTGAPPAGPTRRPTSTRPAPTASPTPGCANDAEYLADLTAPDGAQFLPGQTFTKKWSMRNAGSCAWGPGYRLVFLSGEPLTAPPGGQAQTEFALYPARAGAQAVWEVPMRAPDQPGEYLGRWQARDPQGNYFGGVVYVKIEVIALPGTGTPAP